MPFDKGTHPNQGHVPKILVRIKPTLGDHERVIKKYGNLFWLRDIANWSGIKTARLIPMKDGISYPADFIFVPLGDVFSLAGDAMFTQQQGDQT